MTAILREESEGVGSALELCVMGTAMPHAIPPFAVCCATLLSDCQEEWSDPKVRHLIALATHTTDVTIMDPLEDVDADKLVYGKPRTNRVRRPIVDESPSCPKLGAQGALIDASANHRALLRQYRKDQDLGLPSSRATQYLPYSSTTLCGNANLTRLGLSSSLSQKEQCVALKSPDDGAFRKNPAVCGPQGFGYYARARFRGPLFFLSMIDGTPTQKQLTLPGYQSTVLSNPRNLEQVITLGPKGETAFDTQLHLVDTAHEPPELVDTIDTTVKGSRTSNGCHYHDLAATDHPLIIAASLKESIRLVDVRNLNVLKAIPVMYSNPVICSIRHTDWLALVRPPQDAKKK